MISVRFVPLPRPTDLRPRRSRFQSTWTDSFELLKRELRMVGASNVVLQAGYETGQLRNDGWPRSASNPSHPAVIVSFSAKGRELSFPCFQYDRLWDNIRAIALSLEALRAVDRYGVTQRAEQYQGWAQIEAPKPEITREQAAVILADFASHPNPVDLLIDREFCRAAYRKAARSVHPDVNGGDRRRWDELEKCMGVLERHHGR